MTNSPSGRRSRTDLAALTSAPVDALRSLFLDDVLSRPRSNDTYEQQTNGLADRVGNEWVVFDKVSNI